MNPKHREEFSKSDPSSLLHVAEGKRLLEVHPTPRSLEILYSVFDRHGRDESRQPTPNHPENAQMRHLSRSFYQPASCLNNDQQLPGRHTIRQKHMSAQISSFIQIQWYLLETIRAIGPRQILVLYTDPERLLVE